MLCIPSVYYYQVENSGEGYKSPMYTYTTVEPTIVEQRESRIELIEALATLIKEIPKSTSWDHATDHIQDAICSISRSIVKDYEPEEEDEDDD